MANKTPRSLKRPAESSAEGETAGKKMEGRTRQASKRQEAAATASTSSEVPETAPPTAKEPVPGGNTSSLESLMLAIESRQNAKMDKLVDSIKSNTEQVKLIKDLVDSKEVVILEEVRSRDVKTNARIDELSAAIAASAGNNSREAKRSEAFSEHRRSLRVWPCPGPELKVGLAKFLKDKLKLTNEELASIGNVSIKKVRASKEPEEVVVLFESKAARDLIKAAGKNLANCTGKAGMRLHIPGHLQANFNLLQNLGYHLRQSDDSIKRSIKFDEEKEDLVMDVLIDGTWSRIRPDEAKKVIENEPNIASGPKILSADRISGLLKKKNPATGANAQPL